MSQINGDRFNYQEHSHLRYNPLTGDWILVSPHRAKRPWLGQIENQSPETRLQYDPKCYLCPGNSRAGGVINPEYDEVFTFQNDFPALMYEIPESAQDTDGLLVTTSERGICRVVCFTPRHDLTLAIMETSQIKTVIDVWIDQFLKLSQVEWIRYVQIFENRGEMMGCSNPHPHCQIWATESLPNEVIKEDTQQRLFLETTGTCMLCKYLDLELHQQERIVVENDHFVALVPFWAVWPFETMILSRRHISSIDHLSEDESSGLSDLLHQLTIRYDNLFKTSFPYSMGFHQRPVHSKSNSEWHLHAHFYPPLLRSATVRKFMVGFEMLATPQRDITAETAAERLRSLSGIHFSKM